VKQRFFVSLDAHSKNGMITHTAIPRRIRIMSAEVKKEIELQIAHLLLIDLVGYSKLLVDD
jgi:hypothetical protein